MNYKIRKTKYTDESILKEMLYHAIYVPAGSSPLCKTIVELPELAGYYIKWGKTGDTGIIAESENEIIAAIWIRLFNNSYQGYGFIDKNIPELSMSVITDYQGQGIGTKLLHELLNDDELADYKAISLSVDKTNRAVNLYKRFGFEIFNESKKSYIMIKKFK